MTYSLDDLAFAYELFQEGCEWKQIARGMGGDWRALHQQVKRLEVGGIHDPRTVVPGRALELARIMRTNSRLSWNAIGAHLGISGTSLRYAYSRRVTRSNAAHCR